MLFWLFWQSKSDTDNDDMFHIYLFGYLKQRQSKDTALCFYLKIQG